MAWEQYDTDHSLRRYLDEHSKHGKGPWIDVKIGEWNRYMCGCGVVYSFTDWDAQTNPGHFSPLPREQKKRHVEPGWIP